VKATPWKELKMPHATLEEVLKEAEALPPNERQLLRQVLSDEERSARFGALLIWGLLYLFGKMSPLTPAERRELQEALNRAAGDSGLMSKADAVRAVRGSYSHLPTSSEAFAAQKRGEIELEDRR
jgi:hypothetical protein